MLKKFACINDARPRRRQPRHLGLLCAFGLAFQPSLALAQAPSQAPTAPAPAVNINASLLIDGMRFYDAARYPDAITSFSRAIDLLNAGDPQQRDLLARAYEYRARARYVVKDTVGTELDFTLLLRLRPDYQPAAEMSPRVLATFVDVKKKVVGEMSLRLSPPGELIVDGVSYTVGSEPLIMPVVAGEHTVAAKRRAYAPVEQKILVVAGETVPVAITLERTSATFIVRTAPEGVEVLFDGVPKGVTVKGTDRPDVSAPLVIQDLAKGTYVTRYQRECYRPLERPLEITQFADSELLEPIRLDPSVAKVALRMSEPNATIYLDGVSKGSNAAEVTNVCEGEHLIDVRSPRGRFIDRRFWRTGDVETLNVVLRPAFAIVVNVPPAGVSATEFRNLVERGLAGARGALIFTPTEEELNAARRPDELSAEFFHGTSTAAALRRSETGDRVAARLGAQGIVAIESGGRPDSVQMTLLAAGSSEPEVLTFDLNDQTSRANAVTALTTDVPTILRLSIDALVVDVASVPGAVVVRATQGSGLLPGDVIVDVAGTSVTSVAELMARLNGQQGQSVPVTVRSAAGGATRSVSLVPRLVPDTIPLADRHLLYNGLLLRLAEALREAKTPFDATAARLNLAIVQMRLGRWGEAAGNLEQLRLPDGPGVSAGTVAYLLGLCYDAVGRRADAVASYTTASKSADSMLSLKGPRTAALAQEKLQLAGAPR